MAWLASLVSGAFRGLSTSLMDWWNAWKAGKDRARADSFESAHKGGVLAEEAEREIEAEMKRKLEEPPGDLERW